MAITAKLYVNGDDVFLAWRAPPIAGCLGFAVHRTLTPANGQPAQKGFIVNRTGFEGDDNPPHSFKSSAQWPFQRYTWTDHGVSEGDVVAYRIVPVKGTPTAPAPDETMSVTVGPVKATAQAKGKSWAYFNRGTLMSQFMARELGDKVADLSFLNQLKKSLQKDDSRLRKFLSGELGARLLTLLDDAAAKGQHLYAALYELDDAALIARLAILRKRAHVVLSNGSKKKKGEDGNAEAAAALDGVIDLTRRMLWSKGLGHNKFVVFARRANEPFAVWTGSTNWATTGLCTQANNGIYIEHTGLAKLYFEQYKRLKADNALFGDALVDSNNVPKDAVAMAGVKRRVWFTRTRGGQDMADAGELINNAEKAVLFLMFEPGNGGLLPVIQSRLSSASATFDPALYVQGVVNSFKPGGKGADGTGAVDARVEVIGRGENKPFDLRIIQPDGIRHDLASWAREVTRREFVIGSGGVIGHAIVHSKIIVIDPLTSPVVITGSHNFSANASSQNDENFLVIRGDSELAQRYCVNIMNVYQHYRWRQYLIECEARGISPWQGLRKSDHWQDRMSASRKAELDFWVGSA